MEIESVNLKLRQHQIAEELGCSSSFLKRYRQDINMLSPYRIPSNSDKRKHKISNREHDLKRPRMISTESSPVIKTVRPSSSTKNKLEGGSLSKNFEIDDTYLDEIIKTNNSDCLNGISNANYV